MFIIHNKFMLVYVIEVAGEVSLLSEITKNCHLSDFQTMNCF